MIDLKSIADKISYKYSNNNDPISPEMKLYRDGTKFWYLNGKLHNENGPAIEFTNGNKEWRINGLLHREDGPAIEHANGDKYWYTNGNLHREDGPAVEKLNGTKFWYLNDHKIEYDPETWGLKVEESRIDNIMNK